jgi:hypothetical protein
MESPDNTTLDRMTLTSAEKFINKSCIIYGRSGSGKSHIIKHILYLLRDHVPNVIVFSQSERNNSAYSESMVPRGWVHDCVTEEMIHAIAQRQGKARRIFESATNLTVLDQLFERIATDRQRAARGELRRIFDEIAARAVTIDEATRTTFQTNMVKFYKSALTPMMSRLMGADDLNEEERFALKWFGFNPRITIVFDDCSTDLSKFKSCADVLEQIFQGRHFFCTTIIALHSESMVLPAMRGNVSMSFFTDPQMARQWATRTNNGFPKAKREVLMRYADQILVSQAPNTKMLFAGDRPYLIEVPGHGAFSAVSAAVREYGEKIAIRREPGGIEPWMKTLM